MALQLAHSLPSSIAGSSNLQIGVINFGFPPSEETNIRKTKIEEDETKEL